MTAPLTAACLCGRIKLELTLPSRWVAHCHCNNCRRAHGAAFVTWAGFDEKQVRCVAGESELVHFDTDVQSRRSFCNRCGSTLLFGGERWPGEVHVAVGNIEGQLDREPAVHAYADRAVSWCPILDDLPKRGGESGTEPLT